MKREENADYGVEGREKRQNSGSNSWCNGKDV